jgi:hypothetical protein
MVSFIGGAAYAKKDDGSKADKEKQKMTDAASKQNEDAEKEAKEAKGKAEKKAEKAKKETEGKVKDANAVAGEKKSEAKKPFGFAWGKDHKQQLKALDEKATKVDAKNKEKVAALEKELADAKAANDAEKAATLEKKLAGLKENAAKDMKKIEDKRAKIKAAAKE